MNCTRTKNKIIQPRAVNTSQLDSHGLAHHGLNIFLAHVGWLTRVTSQNFMNSAQSTSTRELYELAHQKKKKKIQHYEFSKQHVEAVAIVLIKFWFTNLSKFHKKTH